MLDLFPDSASVEGGAAHARRVPRDAARRGARHAARRPLRGRRSRAARGRSAPRSATAACFFGTKALPNVALLRLLREEGIGADVASAGELAFAEAAGLERRRARRPRQQQGRGVPRARRRALGAPVVLDAPDEAELAAAAGVRAALVRVTLGVDADTHEAIRTGHHGSKFGLPPDQARAARRRRARPRARRARRARPRRLAARRTSTRRRRRSSGWRRSSPAAATSSAGSRRWPTSAAASGSATTPTTTSRTPPSSPQSAATTARLAFVEAGPAAARDLARARPLPRRAAPA